jgi:hypothetical protein
MLPEFRAVSQFREPSGTFAGNANLPIGGLFDSGEQPSVGSAKMAR